MTTSSLPPRLEGPELEQAAFRYLNAMRPRIDSLSTRIRDLETPRPGSWLDVASEMSQPFECNQLVSAYLNVAVDHIQTALRVLEEPVPLLATYSLIRSALEASSIGLWILDADSSTLAASRTLQIYWNDLDDNRKMWNDTMGRKPDYNGELRELLAETHDRLDAVDRKMLERKVNTTEAIEAVDAVHHDDPPEGQRGLRGSHVWRMSSAAAHANIISISQLLERHEVGDDGEVPLRTAKVSEVVAALDTAVHRTQSLLDQFVARGA